MIIVRRLVSPVVSSASSGLLAMTSPGRRPSSDMAAFREHLAAAKSVVILTGAGVSAESGVPTFRGAGGLWRKYSAPGMTFSVSPILVYIAVQPTYNLVLVHAGGHPAA